MEWASIYFCYFYRLRGFARINLEESEEYGEGCWEMGAAARERIGLL